MCVCVYIYTHTYIYIYIYVLLYDLVFWGGGVPFCSFFGPSGYFGEPGPTKFIQRAGSRTSCGEEQIAQEAWRVEAQTGLAGEKGALAQRLRIQCS